MTNDTLVKALYNGYCNKTTKEGKAVIVEYLIPQIIRWGMQWHDGTLDPFSTKIMKFGYTREKNFLLAFGTGAKLVEGTWDKKGGVYFCIAKDAKFDFSLMPEPQLIVERLIGRQYYLYRLEDYDNL